VGVLAQLYSLGFPLLLVEHLADADQQGTLPWPNTAQQPKR
jgi:hypothetical protein